MPAKILPHLSHHRPIYIIGLNSGTSADGLDVALVRFSSHKIPEVLECRTYGYPDSLRERIIALGEVEFRDGIAWLALDRELGVTMGRIVKRFVKRNKVVDLIGSHGQTIRHLPKGYGKPLTLQIGDAAQIARLSGLPVVSDFRRNDIASGGQGAPMSPILHEALFRTEAKARAIVNIGGIANVTLLPPIGSSREPQAGDSGPGNMAVDLAMKKFFGKKYDASGKTARKGNVDTAFVTKMLATQYFDLRPPKSTGRELFGQNFLASAMNELRCRPPEDIIATLSEITVASIAYFILRFGPKIDEIYLCGGGAKNRYITGRLREIFKGNIVDSTTRLGYDPDYLEALLWAYLAYCFVSERTVNARYFTGAVKPYIPGKLCLP
jgi:anhydro-N-acetylmuramic acid kinase